MSRLRWLAHTKRWMCFVMGESFGVGKTPQAAYADWCKFPKPPYQPPLRK